MGVKVVSPSSGYYIFPDFDVIRRELAQRDIQTGNQMCSAILKDINVAVSSLYLTRKLFAWLQTMKLLKLKTPSSERRLWTRQRR